MVDDPSRAESASDSSAGVSGTDDSSSAVDAPAESTVGSDEAGSADASGTNEPRSVVVPTAVYKRVTVFSTLFAVVAVVGGFLLLDVATDRATAALSEVDPFVALAGVGLIAVGAVTYAFSTRFRADGMGNAKDDTDEPSNNG